MAKIVYTFTPNRAAIDFLLKNNADFTYLKKGEEFCRDWLESNAKDANVIVVPPWQYFQKEHFDVSPKLKLLLINGSGTDKVDIEEASKRRVCVANAPDAFASAVAEFALSLSLSLLRNVVEGDRVVREGKWTGSETQSKLVGTTIRGKKVGIIGLGRIGAEAARLFSLLGANVIYWNRTRKPEVEHALSIEYVDLDDLMSSSDIIIISIALTPQTRGLIGAERLKLMKEGAILINVARGPVVDEKALIDVLRTGRIKAGLDVFEKEPLPLDSELLKLRNLIITPHIAGFQIEALVQTSLFTASSAMKFIVRGELPYTVLNKSDCI